MYPILVKCLATIAADLDPVVNQENRPPFGLSFLSKILGPRTIENRHNYRTTFFFLNMTITPELLENV